MKNPSPQGVKLGSQQYAFFKIIDDGDTTIQFTHSEVTVSENNPQAFLNVTRFGSTASTQTFKYNIDRDSATCCIGLPNYQIEVKEATFEIGEAFMSIGIDITNDEIYQAPYQQARVFLSYLSPTNWGKYTIVPSSLDPGGVIVYIYDDGDAGMDLFIIKTI